MALEISTTPPYPVPGALVHVAFGSATGNWVRVWVTAAPTDSVWNKKLDEADANGIGRVQAFEGDTSQRWDFDADVGGRFTLAVQEYNKGSGFGGGFKGDPDGDTEEQKIGAELELELYIGERFTMPIGAGKDESELVIWVWNDTIRRTTLALHNEASPSITPGPSETAVTAARASAVTTALAALVDETVEDVVGNLDTVFSNMLTIFSGHALGASFHLQTDTENSFDHQYDPPHNAVSLPVAMNALQERFTAHVGNDDRTGEGPNNTDYHNVAAVRRVDNTNTMVARGFDDMASVMVGMGDFWRAYEAHRANSTVHTTPDSTYSLAALPPLLAVHAAFMTAIVSFTPSPAPGQQDAAARLSGIGATKKPL